MIDRWNSSSGLPSGPIAMWSILPSVRASKTGCDAAQSPQRTAATRSAVGSTGRTAAKTSISSGSWPLIPPTTSAAGVPAARSARSCAASPGG